MSLLGTIGSVIAGIGKSIKIPVLGDVFSSLGSSASKKEENKISFNQQKELASYQAAISDQQWKERFDMQNEYSTPSEQIRRLIAAGLNPNLAYGGGLQSGNISSNPSTTPTSGQLSHYVTQSEMELQNLQKAAMKADIEKTEAEANEINTRAEGNSASNHYQRMVNDALQAAIEEVGYNPFKETYLNNETERGFTKFTETMQQQLYNLQEQELGYKMDVDYQRLQIECKYLANDIKRLGLERKYTSAQCYQLYQAGQLAIEQGKLTRATTQGVYYDNGFKKANVSWANWNAAMDAAIKKKNHQISDQEYKNLLVQHGILEAEKEYKENSTAMPYFQMADIVAGRLESIANTAINASKPFSSYQPMESQVVTFDNYNSNGVKIGRQVKTTKNTYKKK